MVQHIITDVANYLTNKGRWTSKGRCCSCGVESGDGLASDESEAEEEEEEEGEDSNTCKTCGGVARYFDQEGLAANEKAERAYYEGNAAGENATSFQWVKAFSDGCAAQFMCATFLYFLSAFAVLFGLNIVWNWFCSCHVSWACGVGGGVLVK